ncbi:MAG: CAP domain-containing protein [Firmicutes bacterium]|nr:CAP domain-containing protein [Bacillota bacterium]
MIKKRFILLLFLLIAVFLVGCQEPAATQAYNIDPTPRFTDDVFEATLTPDMDDTREPASSTHIGEPDPTTSPSSKPRTQTPQVTVTPKKTLAPTPDATPKVTVKSVPVSTATPTPVVTLPPTPPPTQLPTSEPVIEYKSSHEQTIFKQINASRQAAGLSALAYHNGARDHARLHSKDMAENNFFSHTSPTRGSFETRILNSGLSFSWAGENLYMGTGISGAHEALMDSLSHKANIMKAEVTHVGIGVVWDSVDSRYYVTEIFLRQ